MKDGKSWCGVAHIASMQLETSPCPEALCVRWPGPVDCPQCDPNSEHVTPPPGMVTTALAKAAIENWTASRAELCLPLNDLTMVTPRKACLDRRQDKDPVIRKSLCAGRPTERRRV